MARFNDRPAARSAAMLLIGGALAGCIPQMDAPQYDRPPPPQASRDRRSPERADQNVEALPAPPPAWEGKSVQPDARTIAGSSYTVRSGDSLRSIADRTGSGSEAIARANGLQPPFTIYAGQRLTIPGGRYHLVRSGQTGIAIARAYGVPWAQVVAANDLTDPYILRTGQRILIPGGGGAMSAAERAAAFTLDVGDIVTGGEPAIAENREATRPTASSRRVLPATAAVAAPANLTGGFSWPVQGKIVSRFGPGASGTRNDGIQIAVPLQTPILAAADGVVAYVGDGIAALGGLVIIKHGDGYSTVYGNASRLLVQRGQSVKRGQTIALSGDTGFVGKPEVHFEIRKDRDPVDPLGTLPS